MRKNIELYRVLMTNSDIYRRKQEEWLNNINNEELFNKLSLELELISDVIAEVCGIDRQKIWGGTNTNQLEI